MSYLCILKDLNKINSKLGKLRLIWSNSWNWGLDNPLKFKFLLQIDHTSCSVNLKEHTELIENFELFTNLIQEHIETKNFDHYLK